MVIFMSDFIAKTKVFIAVVLAFFGIGVTPVTPPVVPPAGEVINRIEGNLLSVADSTFENGTRLGDVSWQVLGEGELSLTEGENGGTALLFSGRTDTWHSQTLDIFDCIKANGAGVYTIGMSLYLEGEPDGDFVCGQLIRGTRNNSFISHPDNYLRMKYVYAPKVNTWLDTQLVFTVNQSDIDGDDSWRFCFDMLTPQVGAIMVDNVFLKKVAEPEEYSQELIPEEC